MKTFTELTAAIIAFALVVPGCVMIDSSLGLDPIDNRPAIVGSGHLVSVTLNFTNFRNISLSHGFKAKIEKGSSYSVRVEIDDNIEQYLRAYQSGDAIHIGLEDNNYRSATLTVTIVTPDLSVIEASGAASVSVSGFTLAHNVELTGSGASAFKGDLSATEVILTMSGASSVDLSGRADKLGIEGSGAIVLRLLGFPVKTCKVGLSGASVSEVSVSDSLEVTLSGGSVFRYKGNPVTRVVSISGGSIIQRLY